LPDIRPEGTTLAGQTALSGLTSATGRLPGSSQSLSFLPQSGLPATIPGHEPAQQRSAGLAGPSAIPFLTRAPRSSLLPRAAWRVAGSSRERASFGTREHHRSGASEGCAQPALVADDRINAVATGRVNDPDPTMAVIQAGQIVSGWRQSRRFGEPALHAHRETDARPLPCRNRRLTWRIQPWGHGPPAQPAPPQRA